MGWWNDGDWEGVSTNQVHLIWLDLCNAITARFAAAAVGPAQLPVWPVNLDASEASYSAGSKQGTLEESDLLGVPIFGTEIQEPMSRAVLQLLNLSLQIGTSAGGGVPSNYIQCGGWSITGTGSGLVGELFGPDEAADLFDETLESPETSTLRISEFFTVLSGDGVEGHNLNATFYSRLRQVLSQMTYLVVFPSLSNGAEAVALRTARYDERKSALVGSGGTPSTGDAAWAALAAGTHAPYFPGTPQVTAGGSDVHAQVNRWATFSPSLPEPNSSFGHVAWYAPGFMAAEVDAFVGEITREFVVFVRSNGLFTSGGEFTGIAEGVPAAGGDGFIETEQSVFSTDGVSTATMGFSATGGGSPFDWSFTEVTDDYGSLTFEGMGRVNLSVSFLSNWNGLLEKDREQCSRFILDIAAGIPDQN